MDDLISRQAAIDALRNRWLKTINYDGIGEDIAEDCEICLKTVPSAEVETQMSLADCISRQAAIDAFCEDYCSGHHDCKYYPKCENLRAIQDLPSARSDLITIIQNGIKATDADDEYSCGMRNGMRWCKSLIDDKEPLYENCPSVQPAPKKGEWIEIEVWPERYDIFGAKTWASEMQCNQCGFQHTAIQGHMAQYNFCPSCGAYMRGERDE